MPGFVGKAGKVLEPHWPTLRRSAFRLHFNNFLGSFQMMRTYWPALVIVAVAASLLLTGRAARAEVTVCDHEQSGESHFAVAYLAKPSDWYDEGYTFLRAGKCATLLSHKAIPHPYYIYIVTSNGGQFKADKKFCVVNAGFTNDHAEVNTPAEARTCVATRGAQMLWHGIVIKWRVASFFRIDQAGKNSARVTFDSENLDAHAYNAQL
jgi:uncharacterized membrane protein